MRLKQQGSSMFASDIPLERQEKLLEDIAQRIIKFKLSTIAIVFLESMKPLSFVGSQLMIFAQPIFHTLFPITTYDEIAALLEERSNVERLIQKIEKLEEESDRKRENKKDISH